MEQQVYLNINEVQKYYQNQQQQMHQQQGQLIMDSNNAELMVQQPTIQQQDNTSQQQQIIYSSTKQDGPQYIIQTDDSALLSQYVQLPQQTAQPQVFYANLGPQNQNRNQTIVMNHNMMQQPPKLVLQSQPKVVVQRNPDVLQPTAGMTMMDQNQQVQYYQQHLNQNSGQTQLVIHQNELDAYHQQAGTNQILSPQTQYIQIPNNALQQPTKIHLVHAGNRSFNIVQQNTAQQSQQVAIQQNSVGGATMQFQQHSASKAFRPSANNVRLRITSPNQGQQKIIQTSSGQQVVQQRVRAPRPTVVRPSVRSPIQNVQQPRVVQPSNGPRFMYQSGNQQYYIVQTTNQTPAVQPQINQNSTQQVLRVVKTNTTLPQVNNNNHVPAQTPVQQIQQQQAPPTVKTETEAVETQVPTTSTLPKKDGDCDDLEDSITATAISKAARPESSPNSSISISEYRKRQRIYAAKPLNNIGQQRSAMQARQTLPTIRQRYEPHPQQPSDLNRELGVGERESAKMLVLLDNGEQRLITFTLPKETCTVQELLDQVGIQVGADSNIECIENTGSEIDYIVKVGNFTARDTVALTKAAEIHIRQQHAQAQQRLIQTQRNFIQQANAQQSPQQQGVDEKPNSPEPKPLPPPKFINGLYAVCGACGFSGNDHAKCERCHRIFTEEPKTVRVPSQPILAGKSVLTIGGQMEKKVIHPNRLSLDRKDHMEAIQKKHQAANAESQRKNMPGRSKVTSTQVASSTPARGRGRGVRAKNVVPEVVTLSSDDESASDEIRPGGKIGGAKKLEIPIQPKKPFEPEIVDDTPTDDFMRCDVIEFQDDEQKLMTNIACRTIRIGSHKFDSKEKVAITAKGIRIVAPSVKDVNDLNVLNIQHSEIIKIAMHCSKQLHIIFIYTKPSCARYIVGQLGMTMSNDKSPYFAPLSRYEPHKKIVLLAESMSEENKSVIKAIYNRPNLDEINNRDANELLVRSTGIPINGPGFSTPTAAPNNTFDGSIIAQDLDVRKLLIYPKGRGGISINTYDYLCLGSDNYLNDVIIDFYLKYLHLEIITSEQREKTHIFSQFFYKRLTTMTKEKDLKLSAAQKRHQRVQSWTKNVNLFEKDFVIIPINEQSHWFLAIICFPNLTEPHTMDTNQPIKLMTPVQKKAKKKASVTIGNTTITPMNKRAETINLGDEDGSERDEAEGDESELGSNGESDDEEVVDEGQPVKVPCILIFDSLGGASRARVVATLRDYLTCEYKAKYPAATLRSYTKSNMAGNLVKVPQQNNFTDCGLFLLQYVEQFFKTPIPDFRVPIKSLNNWFHQDVVTRKREEIAKLLQELIKREHPEGIELPEIDFPTKDGRIIVQPDTMDAVDDAFDESSYVPTEEDKQEANQNGSSDCQQAEEVKRVLLPKKRSFERNDSSSGESNSKTQKLEKAK